jgi:hypothetical protein
LNVGIKCADAVLNAPAYQLSEKNETNGMIIFPSRPNEKALMLDDDQRPQGAAIRFAPNDTEKMS